MYDRHLDSFVRVVERGSFAKAAAELFVSSNALIKQIDLLEDEIGVKLLERTHTGVTPTAAGRCLFTHALDMIAESRSIVAQVRAAAGKGPTPVRLGTSVFRPAGTTGKLWYAVADRHPNIRLDLVRLPDEFSKMREVYARIGADVDIIVSIEPSTVDPIMKGCRTRWIFDSPLCVAVPLNHPLAKRERLSIRDLYDERVSMAAPEVSPYMESFHRYLAMEHPQIIRDEKPPYDLDEANRCFSQCELLLSCAEWDAVHPGMSNKRVDWGRWGDTIGFTATYSKNAPMAVLEFLDAICSGRTGQKREAHA